VWKKKLVIIVWGVKKKGKVKGKNIYLISCSNNIKCTHLQKQVRYHFSQYTQQNEQSLEKKLKMLMKCRTTCWSKNQSVWEENKTRQCNHGYTRNDPEPVNYKLPKKKITKKQRNKCVHLHNSNKDWHSLVLEMKVYLKVVHLIITAPICMKKQYRIL